ncbi:hypothetical protein JCM24511_01743 [Saitozyma sp. JCM 24511]|nr:hypothetical protein JCM24511_01743 [Saitozyma sp. JCM 24511]
MPPMQKPLRSQQSLEAELKFVHRIVEERDEELRDRETYIRQLEDSLRHTHTIPSRKTSAQSLHTLTAHPSSASLPRPSDIPLPPSPTTPAIALPLPEEPETPRKGLLNPSSASLLSPVSTKRFDALRDSVGQLERGDVDVLEAHGKVDDLMREMAAKEASQRHVIEQQFVQIADLQRANLKLREELADGSPGLERALEELEELRQQRSDLNRKASRSSIMVEPVRDDPPSPAPSINSALNKLREEHAEELQAVINAHAESTSSLREQHTAALDELRATLENTKTDLTSQLARQQEDREAAIAELHSAHQAAIEALHQENEALAVELESALSSSEEQRRQLKMKADQAMFELSRVRDEHQIARSADLKQLSELNKSRAMLEKTISELEGARADLAKRNSELENRWSKRTTVPPPQGPPPNLPLPPLPAGMAATSRTLEEERTRKQSGGSSQGHGCRASDSIAESERAADSIRAADTDGQREQQLEAARKAMESKLQETITKTEALTKELADSRKTNSKLRAHLEDARQENKRAAETCRSHMEELDERRSVMAELDRSRRNERDSLVAANAQVASLRAQLDRAVDAKVNKKLNNKLKCF